MDVIIPGTFDLFHEGHKKLIMYGDKMRGTNNLLIFVNGDELSKSKGKTPTEPCSTRVYHVEQYLEDNNIRGRIIPIIKDYESVVLATIRNPCFWLTGRDWNRKSTSERNNVPERFWEDNDIYLVYKDRLPGVSSTEKRR